MVAQEALTDKGTCEQKPEGDEGGDRAISGVKTTTERTAGSKTQRWEHV